MRISDWSSDVCSSDLETRYAYAQEWFEIVERLWSSSKPFDYNGKFFQLEGAYCDPRPVHGRPLIINAAGSSQGREFALRNADMLFTPVDRKSTRLNSSH